MNSCIHRHKQFGKCLLIYVITLLTYRTQSSVIIDPNYRSIDKYPFAVRESSFEKYRWNRLQAGPGFFIFSFLIPGAIRELYKKKKKKKYELPLRNLLQWQEVFKVLMNSIFYRLHMYLMHYTRLTDMITYNSLIYYYITINYSNSVILYFSFKINFIYARASNEIYF